MNYAAQYTNSQMTPYYSPTPRPMYGVSNQMSSSRVRPVSSIEEVRASTIDFDGSVFFFPDQSKNCIHTKQINLDGTATIKTYCLKEEVVPIEEVVNEKYVTKEEFNETIKEIKDLLQPNEKDKVKEFAF